MGGRNPPSAQGNWAQVSSLLCPKALRGFSRQYPGPKESIPLTSELRGPLREDLSRPPASRELELPGCRWDFKRPFQSLAQPTCSLGGSPPQNSGVLEPGTPSECSQLWLLVRIIFQNIKLEILTSMVWSPARCDFVLERDRETDVRYRGCCVLTGDRT